MGTQTTCVRHTGDQNADCPRPLLVIRQFPWPVSFTINGVDTERLYTPVAPTLRTDGDLIQTCGTSSDPSMILTAVPLKVTLSTSPFLSSTSTLISLFRPISTP